MKSLLRSFLAFAAIVLLFNSNVALALSNVQRSYIAGGSKFVDEVASCGANTTTSQSGSSVYVVGDSLTVGMRDLGGMEEKFTEKGWNVNKIEATGGHRIEDALPKVVEGKDLVSKSDTIVVALGTNRSTDFPGKIDELIAKIKEFSPSANIYWVNIGDSTLDEQINTKSTEHGFTVIDWATELSSNPGAYPLADAIHQTAEGYKARAQWTVDQLGQPSESGSLPESDSPTTAPTAGGPNIQQAPESAKFGYPEIEPTGIVLHWTAGGYDSPEQLINTLEGRKDPGFPQGRAVQLTVDTDGNIYQLSKSLKTRPIQTVPGGEGGAWNDHTIGIEIETESTTVEGARNDLLNNTVQYEKVVELTGYLMGEFGIENVVNLPNYRGVFGHHEINPGNSDPSPEYMEKIRIDLDAVDVSDLGDVPAGCHCGGSSAPNLSGENNVEKALNFYVGKGLTFEQATGIVGNLQDESGPDLDPEAYNVAGNWYGIVQWDGGRTANLRSFASETGRADQFNTLEVQLEFSWYELTGEPELSVPVWDPSGKFLEKFKATTTPTEAALLWNAEYEVGVVHTEAQNAEALFTEYTGKISGGSSGGGVASCGAGTGDIDIFPLEITKAGVDEGVDGAIWCALATSDPDSNCHHDYNANDIHVVPGTPVIAARGGEVIQVHNTSNALVTIKGDQGKWIYTYIHMGEGSVTVNIGDTVTSGQVIGQVGTSADTGNMSAPHLHIDLLPAAEHDFRPACKGAACSDLPFLDAQSQLLQLYETQLR